MKVIWNDQIVDESQVVIHREDRGYQFGDGLYEVIRIYNGQLFMANEHFERLVVGANKIKLPLPYSIEQMQSRIQELIEIETIVNGYVYFQITRGVRSPRSHAFPPQEEVNPIWTATVTALDRMVEMQEKGLIAATVEDRRWLHCDIKSLSLLGNILSLEEAKEKGADDALLYRNGVITEASASNVWFVKDHIIYTHPDGNLILPGITKIAIKKILNKLNYQLIEEAFPLSELDSIDECFISNSVWEIIPITQIDGKLINNGIRGSLTYQLQEAYTEWIQRVIS